MATLEIDMRDVTHIEESLDNALAYIRLNFNPEWSNENTETSQLIRDLMKSLARINSTKKHGPH